MTKKYNKENQAYWLNDKTSLHSFITKYCDLSVSRHHQQIIAINLM